jgi:hypothetical protein
MRPSLNNREGLLAVGDSYPSDQKSSMISAAKHVRHYIGTIEIPGIARGTGCLLEDGRILTCLHNILDYDALDERKAELIDFEAHDVSVYFVKDDEIFKYKINSAPVTGINHLKASQLSSWCFDYAFLETEGNPVRDLGGGFKLDQTNHFGSAFASDPAQTLAISGPFIKMTEDGNLKAYRYVSLSENQAAQSQYYHITQAGDHPSAPGFSGMGMVPVDSSYSVDTLYAIHSYRDNQGQQTGAKISEIRSSMRDEITARDSARLDTHVVDILRNWYETLREATINSNRSVSVGREINFEEAVQIILTGQGNYLSDIKDRDKSRKEVMDPIEEAVKREGMYRLDQIQDHSTPHNPGHKIELPHLHPPSHSTHAFYDTGYWQRKAAEEQEVKRKADENRKRQLDATKARDAKLKEEAESKAAQIKKEREEKERAKQERHEGKKGGKGSKNSGGRF